MIPSLKEFYSTVPQKGEISLLWMGQAGFLIRNSQGKVLGTDLYLSNLSEIQDGNKRLMMPVAQPEELALDLLCVSHHHTDHLDVLSIPVWLKEGTHIVCDRESCRIAGEKDWDTGLFTGMAPGDVFEADGYRVEAVEAYHGDAAKQAVGYLIQTDGILVYFTGDTSWQKDLLSYAVQKDIDILLPPINGEYGNMGERDAAEMAGAARPKLTIPCHFWTFARHYGSPYDFIQEMKVNYPDCPFYMMCQGEMIRYSKEKGLL